MQAWEVPSPLARWQEYRNSRYQWLRRSPFKCFLPAREPSSTQFPPWSFFSTSMQSSNKRIQNRIVWLRLHHWPKYCHFWYLDELYSFNVSYEGRPRSSKGCTWQRSQSIARDSCQWRTSNHSSSTQERSKFCLYSRTIDRSSKQCPSLDIGSSVRSH